MRKSIFDIVKDNTNLANDVLRLDSMFLKEEILRVNPGIPYTLKDYVEDYCFETWKYRNHCLDVDDFLRTVNYNNLKRSATINAEDIFTLIEIIYNFWNLAFGDLEKGTNGLLWSGNFFHLQDVMDDILRQYNYTAYIPEDDECVLVIEDKPEVTATAEIVPETLALDIIRYNHRLLKGNINAKKSILLKLASELEPRRKELQELDKDLTSNIFFMLNNMNIRHNNQNINEPSKYKKYVAEIDNQHLEDWYDELYQMMLLALLLLDNIERQKSARAGHGRNDRRVHRYVCRADDDGARRYLHTLRRQRPVGARRGRRHFQDEHGTACVLERVWRDARQCLRGNLPAVFRVFDHRRLEPVRPHQCQLSLRQEGESPVLHHRPRLHLPRLLPVQ